MLRIRFFELKYYEFFYPSLIHLLLIPVPNDTLGTPNMASKTSELSVNLNVPFTIFAKQMNYFCPKYMSIIFRHSSPICSDSQGHFDPPEVKNVQNIPSPLEPPGSFRSWSAPRRRHPLGSPGRQRPGAAGLPQCGSGESGRERSDRKWPAASNKWGEFLVPGGEGWKVPEAQNMI